MQKLVTVSPLTPAGKTAFAEEVLGLRVVDPSNRFNPGTLAGRVTSAVEAACLVLMAPGLLVACDCGGVSGNAATVIDGLELQPGYQSMGGFLMFDATADVGTGRSRSLVPNASYATVHPHQLSSWDQGDEGLFNALLVAELPSFTSASALSAIFDELQGRDPAVSFVAILNQFNGNIRVYKFDSDANAAAAIETVVSIAAAGTVQAAFALSDPAAPPAGVAGPVWG